MTEVPTQLFIGGALADAADGVTMPVDDPATPARRAGSQAFLHRLHAGRAPAAGPARRHRSSWVPAPGRASTSAR